MGLYDIESKQGAGGWREWIAERPQLPYLLPLLGFLAVMSLGTVLGHSFGIDWEKTWFYYQPAVYTTKTLVGAILLWIFWRFYTPIRWTHLWLGALVGLLGVVQWVGVEYLAQYVSALLGHSRAVTALDLTGSATQLPKYYVPTTQIPDNTLRYLFYFIRVGGPTLVVPVMEELFFRDFLMRALVRGARFQDVEVGTFTWLSLIGMSVLFGVNHGVMWPSGIIYGLMMGALLIRTRSLGACIVAHGVTNLVLYAGYAIPFRDWQFM